MTAPGSGEQITAELARAYSGLTDEAFDAAPEAYRQAWFDDTAALLPVVEAYATRKAAAELRAAAEDFHSAAGGGVAAHLRARADALTATHPDHGKATT